MEIKKIQQQIRLLVLFFIAGLLFAGITAIPLQAELKWMIKNEAYFPEWMDIWVLNVYNGIAATDAQYPFILYGVDWLAYAHIIIAILFIGVLRDPVRNIWIVDWAIISCIIIFPVAFIFGPIREIPFKHQLIDCSFGVIGILVLYFTRKKILLLEKLTTAEK